MQAILIDKWTARNIYEGIVNRRKDPSILYKTSSNSYQLRVYPITTGMNRKLKISYMVPFNFGQEYITAPLPLNILKTSDTIPDFKVTIFPDNMSMRPLIFEYTDISFSKNNNTFTTIIPSSRTKMSSIMNIALANPCSDGLFFNKTTVNGENYYPVSYTHLDVYKRQLQVL